MFYFILGIMTYNFNKNDTDCQTFFLDLADQMLQNCRNLLKSVKNYRRLYHHLLDLCCTNAHVIGKKAVQMDHFK